MDAVTEENLVELTSQFEASIKSKKDYEFVAERGLIMGTGIVESLEDSNLYTQRTSVLGDMNKDGKRNKYIIAIRKSDQRWTCDCMHWKNRCNKSGADCKHITKYKEAIEELFASKGGRKAATDDIIDTLKDLLTLGKKELLARWLKVRDQAFLLDDFLKMSDASEHGAYETLLNQVQGKIASSLSL